VRAREDWSLLDPDVLRWLHDVGPRHMFLRKLTEVRSIIEPAAAALAAARATPDQAAEIEARFAEMRESVGDTDAFIVADLAFHDAIVVTSGNELLHELIMTIARPLLTSRTVTVRSPKAVRASLPMHADVANAISAFDPAAARAAMSRLIEQTARDIDAVLAGSAGADDQEPDPGGPDARDAARPRD